MTWRSLENSSQKYWQKKHPMTTESAAFFLLPIELRRFPANILGKNHLTAIKQFVPKILVGKTPSDRQAFFWPIFLARIPINNNCGNRLMATMCFPKHDSCKESLGGSQVFFLQKFME